MLPTFFLAGVPKAGTTSMYEYLRQHPQIFMCEPKEPHFFSWEDEGWPRWAVKDRRSYEALFASAHPNQERGDASTWTLYSAGAPRRIAGAVPDARFVILLRNPTDRAYSNWAFNYGDGYDPIDSFEEALAAERKRIEGGSPWHHHYVQAGLYSRQIDRYLEVFDRRQFLFLFFEDLRQDPELVVRRAYDFLGVDSTFQADTGATHNVTSVPRSRRLHEYTRRSGRLKSALKSVLPGTITARVGRRLNDINRRPPSNLTPETRRRLNERFRDDVVRLSGLVGRDLSELWMT